MRPARSATRKRPNDSPEFNKTLGKALLLNARIESSCFLTRHASPILSQNKTQLSLTTGSASRWLGLQTLPVGRNPSVLPKLQETSLRAWKTVFHLFSLGKRENTENCSTKFKKNCAVRLVCSVFYGPVQTPTILPPQKEKCLHLDLVAACNHCCLLVFSFPAPPMLMATNLYSARSLTSIFEKAPPVPSCLLQPWTGT